MRAARESIWFVTGVTGFLGKVLLEELVRRRQELHIGRILVLIRARAERSAAQRFRQEVASAKCFAALPDGWSDCVEVLEGDLERVGLGIPDTALRAVTHVVHSAASIEFNLPVRDALTANVHATLNLLEAARRSRVLERFVYVSTAYVTPHPGNRVPIPERLVALPMEAERMFRALDSGAMREDVAMAKTGHPNTYTLTKCLAEHLLVRRVGEVPLSIVRPSIISAARALPFPGWIDSTAGFGAFAALVGSGHLRAVVGEPEAQIDVVPVDDVVARVIAAAREHRGAPRIVHAVSGRAAALTIGESWEIVQEWFRRHPIARRPQRGFIGSSRLGFRLADLWHHRLPLAIGALRTPALKRRVSKLLAKLEYLNTVFPYFTTRTFDFQTSAPLPAGVLGAPYLRTICRGLYRHVLNHDDHEWVLGGAARSGYDGDLRWTLGQPHGNAWIRAGSFLVTKVLRRTTERVTVDLPSLERARAQVPEGAAIVLVPSHRSYLDFVLCSYLAFARPDLGFPIPHIAATMEFGRIPLLGRVLRAMHAFYLRRGTGKEDPELTRRVRELVERGQSLEFFIEGARSRSREFLPPKRGLLRALQGSGRPVALVPIAISYDRLPEEAAFAAELEGAPKPGMRLGALLRWALRAWRGEISLGRIHMRAGDVVHLTGTHDVHEVADAVIEELRAAMPVTTYHLRQYVALHPIPWHDAESLRRLVEARGYRVLESSLGVDPAMPGVIATTLAEHFRDLVAPVLAQSPSSRMRLASLVREVTPNLR